MRLLAVTLLAFALGACAESTSVPDRAASADLNAPPSTDAANVSDREVDTRPDGTEAAPLPNDVLDAVARHLQDDPALRGELRFQDVAVEETPMWRFVTATVTRPDGSDPGHCPDLDGEVRALLRAGEFGWQVVRSETCSGDVYWLGWPALTGAPASLVGLDEASAPRSAFVRETSDGFLALRSEPGIDTGERLAQIPSGTGVELGACQDEALFLDDAFGRWCETSYDGRDGWAFTGFLD